MPTEAQLLDLVTTLRKLRASGAKGREQYRDAMDFIEDATRYDGERGDPEECSEAIHGILYPKGAS
jgi:hypothetical protein